MKVAFTAQEIREVRKSDGKPRNLQQCLLSSKSVLGTLGSCNSERPLILRGGYGLRQDTSQAQIIINSCNYRSVAPGVWQRTAAYVATTPRDTPQPTATNHRIATSSFTNTCAQKIPITNLEVLLSDVLIFAFAFVFSSYPCLIPCDRKKW